MRITDEQKQAAHEVDLVSYTCIVVLKNIQ